MSEKHKKKAVAKIVKEAEFEIKKTRSVIKRKRKKVGEDKIRLLESDILALETAIVNSDHQDVLVKAPLVFDVC